MVKKIFCFTLALLLSFAVFVGCQSAPKVTYESYVAGMNNDGILTEMERSFWNGGSEDGEALKGTQYTITFDGKEYTGSYMRSHIDLNESFISDRYRTEEGVYFEIRRDTKELVGIEFGVKLYYEGAKYKEEVDEPAATALAIATEYAKQYLADFEDYTVKILEPSVSTSDEGEEPFVYSRHTICFVKKIGNYETSDLFAVVVSSKGDLCNLRISDVGALDEFDITIDDAHLTQNLDAKMKEVYENAGYTLVDYSIIKQTVCVTPEGKPCIMTATEATIKDSSGTKVDTGVDLITYFQTD